MKMHYKAKALFWTCMFIVSASIFLGCESEKMEQGRQLLKERNYEQAADAFQKAIQEDPMDADAYFLKGLSGFQKKFGEGLVDKQKALSYLLGSPLVFRSFDRALTLDPNYDTGIYSFYLGMVYENEREYNRAIREYEKCHENKNITEEYREEAIYRWGVGHLKLEEPQLAIETFSRLAKLYPKSSWRAKALFKTGEAYAEAKDWENALAKFTALSEEGPGPLWLESKYNMALCYEELSRNQDAADAYKSLITASAGAGDTEFIPKAVERLLALNAPIPIFGINHSPGVCYDREISVVGTIDRSRQGEATSKVLSALSDILGEGKSIFLLSDGTGQLWVISDDKEIALATDEITVQGELKSYSALNLSLNVLEQKKEE